MADLDFMVRRNASNTATLPTTGSTLDHTWDTQVAVEGTAITFLTDTFTLVDAGHYLVCVSDQFATTDTTNNERINWMTYLRQAGANIIPGQDSGYIRKSNGSQEYITSGFAVINASASDSLLVRSDRRDNSTTGSPTRAAGDRSGISILKLPDADNYARYATTSDKLTVEVNGTSADIVWDTNVEQDTGFSRSGADITITTAGRYFVSYSVPLDGSAAGARNETTSHIELDGVKVDGTDAQTYVRTTDNSDDGCLSWGGIIDVAALDVLVLRHTRRDGETANCDYISGSCIQLWQLDGGAETAIIECTTGNMNVSATDFAWDTTRHIDTAAFTHTNGQTNIDVDNADDYFVFATQGLEAFSSATRACPAIQFRVNTTDSEIAGSSTFNRNSESGFGCVATGGLLTGLSASDSIHVRNDRIGTNPNAMTIASGQFSVLRVSSLVSAAGHTSDGAMAFGGMSIAATASHDHEGQGAMSPGGLTLAAVGLHPHQGAGVISTGLMSLVGSGSQLTNPEGTGVILAGGLSMIAQGLWTNVGQGSLALAPAQISALGSQAVNPEGTGSYSKAPLALASSSVQDHQSVGSSTFQNLLLASVSVQDHQSTGSLEGLAPFSITSTGSHGNLPIGQGFVVFSNLSLVAGSQSVFISRFSSGIIENPHRWTRPLTRQAITLNT